MLPDRAVVQDRRDVGGLGHREPAGRDGPGVREPPGRVREHGAVLGGALRVLRRTAEEGGTLVQHELDVHPRGQLDGGGVQPGAHRVVPALHHEPVNADLGRTQRGHELVQPGPARAHVDALHLGPVRAEQADRGADGVVALAVHRGADRDVLAHHRLGREPALLDHRLHVRDRDAARQGAAADVRGRGASSGLQGRLRDSGPGGLRGGDAVLGAAGRGGLRFRGAHAADGTGLGRLN